MKYIRTTEATSWKKREGICDKIVQFVYSFVPNANPRYQQKYYLLNEWFIEFDNEGKIQREMGIDLDGKVLFASPYKQNPGFWIESEMGFKDFKNKELSSDEFSRLWDEYFSL